MYQTALVKNTRFHEEIEKLFNSLEESNDYKTPSAPVTEPESYSNGHAKEKFVYLFSEVEVAEENVGGDWEKVRALLGGKGANLGDMTRPRRSCTPRVYGDNPSL